MTAKNTATQLPGTVRIADDARGLADMAAATIVALAREATERSGRFTIALTGGTTPKTLYGQLASEPVRSQVGWSAWQVFFGDERAVPPGDPASNYGAARTALLDHVPIPPAQVFRMRADDPDLDAAAAEYSSQVERIAGAPPRFDCVLLGLGENGHTASLFPGTRALAVRDVYATRGLADYPPADRITLTFPCINGARTVLILVSGASKGQALRDVVHGIAPAALVAPTDGELVWMLDQAAAESAGPWTPPPAI